MKTLKEIGHGSFRPGNGPNGSFNNAAGNAGPTSSADSIISQRMQYNAGSGYVEPEDDYNDDDDDHEEDMDMILECRVYRSGKYCLVETLKNISEIDSRNINAIDKKLSSAAQNRSAAVSGLDDLDDLVKEEDLQEFSGSGAIGGGPVTPIGHTSKGKPETPAQRKKRQRFNITKSFPYNKMTNLPRSKRKKRK